MKVLRVINSLAIGGAETSIANNVPIHKANGIDMDVLLLDGTRTRFLDELQQHGVKVSWLGRGINLYNPLLVLKLLPIFRDYDLIHVHLFPALYWVAFAKLLSRSKAKLVYTEHSTHNRRRDRFAFRLLDRLVYSQYTAIIAISDATKLALDEQVGMPGKSVVIPNGVQIANLRRSSATLPNSLATKIRGRKVLVQIAGFRPVKDQDTTIRALTELPEDYVVIFVGDGERRMICEDLAVELGVDNRVFFAGLQGDVAPFINCADLVVISSHWEGFGRAAVEGMALGKPVVASNVSGLSGVVGGAGRLFDVGNYKGLAKMTLELMDDQVAYAEASENSRARAEEYDVSFMIKGYERVYTSILKDSV
ncbi:MAG: glycosyltransferase [Pseudomonadota bacterium]